MPDLDNRHCRVKHDDGESYVQAMPIVTLLITAAEQADTDSEPNAARSMRNLAFALSLAFDGH